MTILIFYNGAWYYISNVEAQTMKIYGTWHAFMVEQLKEKEEVAGFLDAIIEEYQIHRDLAIIQLALQYVVEAQGGISELAK